MPISPRLSSKISGMFSNPVAVGLDASRFDQHVSLDALKWEHSVYLECFPRQSDKRKLSWMLKQQLVNKCKGYCPDGRIMYTVEGTRMSGDMNTSLGNCVLMCSMIRAYADHVKVDLELANNGDDCVVFMNSKDLERFSRGLDEWFTNMGFTMKVEPPVYDFGKIEFCQTRPVFDGCRWLMVRNPSACLTKDTVFLQPFQSKRQITSWMGAVGLGGLRMTGCLPVLQNFYSLLCRYGKPGKEPANFLSWYTSKLLTSMDRDFGPVSPEARASYYTSFGVTPDEQLELEAFYDQVRLGLDVVEGDLDSFETYDLPL